MTRASTYLVWAILAVMAALAVGLVALVFGGAS
jgi:hypothetical protein